MVPDFRFVLGAVLAIALLAVAGLGLVTSVQLLHEAHMNPLADTRSLAFAGHAEWSQFYDPDGARRFEGSAGKPEATIAPTALETPAITQSAPEERTASIPAHGLDPDITPVIADDKAPDKTLQIDPPHVDPQQSAEPPSTVTIPAPPAERIASAPATLPEPERAQAQPFVPEPTVPEPTQPQTSGDPQGFSPPIPRARPNVQLHRKIAHAHVRSVAPASQSWPNSSYPNAPWPGYDDPITGTTTKKNAGRVSGTLSNRPQ
jgi:hypothetical protein